uniref:Uncharacterized protein n=1 Tax=Rhizophora mucronata TaxID=61149 RepID=A0A2P2MM02_RHIMU
MWLGLLSPLPPKPFPRN